MARINTTIDAFIFNPPSSILLRSRPIGRAYSELRLIARHASSLDAFFVSQVPLGRAFRRLTALRAGKIRTCDLGFALRSNTPRASTALRPSRYIITQIELNCKTYFRYSLIQRDGFQRGVYFEADGFIRALRITTTSEWFRRFSSRAFSYSLILAYRAALRLAFI